jgi:hypothetical protein
MSTKLNVGIVVDSLLVPTWVFRAVEKIEGSRGARVAMILLAGRRGAPGELPRDPAGRFRRALIGAFMRLDRALSPARPDPLAPKDLRQLLPGAVVVAGEESATTAAAAGPGLVVAEEESAAPAAAAGPGLDVLLSFVSRPFRYPGWSPRWGVWSYRWGDDRLGFEAPPGLWEVLNRSPSTSVTLEMRAADGGESVRLCRSHLRTQGSSATRNGAGILWRSASLAARKLEELHREQTCRPADVPAVEPTDPGPVASSAPAAVPPGIIRLASLALAHKPRVAWRRLTGRLTREQWTLLLGLGPAGGLWPSPSRLTRLAPPPDRFWADPFVIRHDGRWHLFFEEKIDAVPKGHIACLSFDDKGERTEPEVVLDLPYHLSYPFVFAHEGEHYMLPESVAAQQVTLFRACPFPTRWEPVQVLRHGIRAADPTLLRRAGRWWLFAAVSESAHGPQSDELCLFYSDELLSADWRPHPRNPVVSDVRSARPAGPFFEHRGELYRPSQDCSQRYGFAVRINKVVKLSVREYAEECVDVLRPDWAGDVLATHTLSHGHGVTAMDALIGRRRFWAGRIRR